MTFLSLILLSLCLVLCLAFRSWLAGFGESSKLLVPRHIILTGVHDLANGLKKPKLNMKLNIITYHYMKGHLINSIASVWQPSLVIFHQLLRFFHNKHFCTLMFALWDERWWISLEVAGVDLVPEASPALGSQEITCD